MWWKLLFSVLLEFVNSDHWLFFGVWLPSHLFFSFYKCRYMPPSNLFLCRRRHWLSALFTTQFYSNHSLDFAQNNIVWYSTASFIIINHLRFFTDFLKRTKTHNFWEKKQEHENEKNHPHLLNLNESCWEKYGHWHFIVQLHWFDSLLKFYKTRAYSWSIVRESSLFDVAKGKCRRWLLNSPFAYEVQKLYNICWNVSFNTYSRQIRLLQTLCLASFLNDFANF